MDSLSKKRKLTEFCKNITPPRELLVKRTSISAEENLCSNCDEFEKTDPKSNSVDVTDECSIYVNFARLYTLYFYVKKSRQFLVILTRKIKKMDEQMESDKENEKSVKKLEPIEELYENEGEKPREERCRATSVFQEDRNKQLNLFNDNDRKDTMWFCTDYIEDIVAHEVYKESLYQLSDKFCRKYDINPTGREILVDWLISIQVHLKAENSSLHLAVALLDIMLDSVHIPLNELQAAAVAAFWVAYKFIHGSISMKVLLGLCAGSVTKEMIEDNEILVLQTSRLIQAGGSLTVFFNYLLYRIFGFKFPPEIYYCGLYFIEIMLLQFIFVDCPAYEKAATAVFTALAVFGFSTRFDFVIVSRFITKPKLQHIYRRLLRSLRLMYKDKDMLKNSSVYRKYKSSRYHKISIHQNLKSLGTK